MQPLAVSIVIPAYNEEERIAATLEEIVRYLSARGLAAEIIVVDDGSTDATRESAAAVTCDPVPLRILGAARNQGKGAALRRGMLEARGEVVLFTDADLSTPIGEFDTFYPLLQAGAPVVIGSRKLEPKRILLRQPVYRQWMGRVFSWAARRFLNPEVSDFTCGFKAFRQEVVQGLFGSVTLSGWVFDAELLHLAWRRRIPVKELPVTWSNRPDTRVRLGRDVLLSAAGLARVLWNGWRGVYADSAGTRR